jgi:ZIP family zinc transporter
MSTGQTVLLGAIAGLTIFLGLPLARMRKGGPKLKIFLNGLSAGVLVFLLFDILKAATEVLEVAVGGAKKGVSSWGHLAGLGLVYAVGFAVGLLGLLYVGRAMKRRSAPSGIGPGAMAVAEATERHDEALRIGMSIAIGIGLHNFSEGLAIGQASQAGAISLAVLLVVGFALHNATEGFGIVGPLVAAEVRPSWGWLALVGLIGGGPTFVGALVGGSITSPYVFVGFLTLAGGAILYVLGELFSMGRRMSWEVTLWGILAGFLLALVTDLILVAAGV